MKNKVAYLLIMLFMVFAVAACEKETNEDKGNYTVIEEADSNIAHVKTDKYFYKKDDVIRVYNFNSTDSNLVCLLALNDEPIKVNRNLRSKTNSEYDEFSVADLLKYSTGIGYGEYNVYLVDSNYTTIYRTSFFILNEDETNYEVSNATISNDNYTSSITVETTHLEELTYKFYWAKDGVRLNDYSPIKTVVISDNKSFKIDFNQNMYAPVGANQIEVVVTEGYSESFYATVPASMQLPESKFLYSFNVLTDIHATITDPKDLYTSHFISTFKELDETHPNSVAIYTVGDNTGNGKAHEYDVLETLLKTYKKSSTPIYYAMGNHDYMYYETFDEGLALFKNRLNMPNHYYSVEVNGSKVIMLSSETTSSYGSMSQTQLNWLKKELDDTDPTKPIYIMIHQPLKNTVAGSLVDLDSNQTAYGFIDGSGNKLREILKSYPNAFVFSGHSHWSMDSFQSTYVGLGKDANYINCSSVAAPEEVARIAGSQGVYVEVYEDYVVVKGREFVKKQWISTNQIIIPLIK